MPIQYVRMVPGSRPFQPPLGIDPLTGDFYTLGTHRNLRELMADVRGFVSQQQTAGRTVRVMAADSPQERLIGFYMFTEGDPRVDQLFNIAMQDLRFTLEHDFSERERELLQTALRTTRGRQMLGQSMLAGLTEPADSPRASE